MHIDKGQVFIHDRLGAESNDFLQKIFFAAHSTCGKKNRGLLDIARKFFDALS